MEEVVLRLTGLNSPGRNFVKYYGTLYIVLDTFPIPNGIRLKLRSVKTRDILLVNFPDKKFKATILKERKNG